MAIAFARVSIHTRSKGHSAIAAAAYRSGSKLYDERTGLTHDFSKRHDIEYQEILLPQNASQKFLDRHTLWNQAELAEKRKDAQLCKDVVLALPKELSLIEHIELAKRFAQHHYVQHGLVCDIAIHDTKTENPHAHILVSMRRLEKDKFSVKKARDLNPGFVKGFITGKDYLGEQWRAFQNDYFQEKNLDIQVDKNHILSEKHQGRQRGNGHYLEESNKIIRQARRDIALKDIDNFINLMSCKISVFSRRDIETLLFKTVLHNEKDYLSTIEKVLGHKDVFLLGKGEDGKERYTTRQHYQQECRLFEIIETMVSKNNSQPQIKIDDIIEKFTLTNEQHHALSHITKGKGISVVIGKPGTGKTYMMKALNEAYSRQGYNVIGTSLAAKAVKGLEAESGIRSHTLASLNYRLAQNTLQLSAKDIIVLDEAGIVDFASMNHLINAVHKAKANLVLVGDPEQLKPIGKGDLLLGIASRVGYFAMEDIKRQQDLGDRNASLMLSQGNIEAGFGHYDAKGQFTFAENRAETVQTAIEGWLSDVKEHGTDETLLLAFSRTCVNDLNFHARGQLKSLGLLKEKGHDFSFIRNDDCHFDSPEKTLEDGLLKTRYAKEHRKIQICVGEKLLFKKKDKTLGIDNGDIGFVTDVNDKCMTVKLNNERTVTIENGRYRHFDYGYALTVHKSQGATVNNTHVVIDSKYWDKYLTFVSMTRHRHKLKLYTNKALHHSKENLIKTLSRNPIKDNVIDWPLDTAIRYGFDPDSVIGKAINHIAGVKNKIKDKWTYLINYEAYLTRKEFYRTVSEKKAERLKARSYAGSKATTVNASKHIKLENTIEIFETVINKYNNAKNINEKIEYKKQLSLISKKIYADKELFNEFKKLNYKNADFSDKKRKLFFKDHEIEI